MKNLKIILIALVFLVIGLFIGKTFFAGKTGENIQTTETVEKHAEHWTCSMHPQIDMPEPGKCPICGMDLIPKKENQDEELAPNRFKMSKNAVELANVQTFTVGENKLTDNKRELSLSGKIVENERNTRTQTAHFGGRIEKLYYRAEGDFVKKGSLIALIYSPELVTAENELIQALEVKESQPELYNSVRKKLLNWKLTEGQFREIEQTKKIITNFKIYADYSGIITKMYIEEGDHVKEGSKLFDIINLSTVWAEFDVFERDISYIKTGGNIKIKPNAYPNTVINAKIDFIDPLLDPQTRTIKIRATVRNKNYKLKPEMIITGEYKIDTDNKSKTAILIPKSAVMWTGKRSIVYVKPKKDKAEFELREVELGKDIGSMYEIVSGLSPGEEVVSNGTFTIDAAAQLQGKASMMNPTAEAGQSGIEMKCAAGKCGDGMKKERKSTKIKEESTKKKDKKTMDKSSMDKKTMDKETMNKDKTSKSKENSDMKCAAGKCGGGM